MEGVCLVCPSLSLAAARRAALQARTSSLTSLDVLSGLLWQRTDSFCVCSGDPNVQWLSHPFHLYASHAFIPSPDALHPLQPLQAIGGPQGVPVDDLGGA